MELDLNLNVIEWYQVLIHYSYFQWGFFAHMYCQIMQLVILCCLFYENGIFYVSSHFLIFGAFSHNAMVF